MCKWNEDWRICSSCNEHKQWSEYHLDKHWVNGRRARCRSCYSAIYKSRRKLYKSYAEFESSIQDHFNQIERNKDLRLKLDELKRDLESLESRREKIEKYDNIIYYMFILASSVILFVSMWMIITQ